MSKNLNEIFLNHKGKLSDRWLLYIDEWNTLFQPLHQKKINLLEIGVHNGGSLEIWAKYFTQAENIIGCDKNEACQQLDFSDPRISVILGDINTDNVESIVKEKQLAFDIIIDDGSHTSVDIIESFSFRSSN